MVIRSRGGVAGVSVGGIAGCGVVAGPGESVVADAESVVADAESVVADTVPEDSIDNGSDETQE